LFLWTALKIAELRRRGKFRMAKLSNLVLVLILVAFLIKLGAIFFDYTRLFIFNNSNTVTLFAQVVLRIIPISLWLAASALILGFWFDVLKKKLLPTMAKRTRVICICGASLMLLQIPGFALLSAGRIGATIGALLVILPYFVNIIGLVVISILIGRRSNKKLSIPNAAKKSFAIKKLIIIDVAWVAYVLLFVCIIFAVNVSSAYWVFIVLSSLCEVLISVLLVLLVDRHGGPIKLFKFVVLNQDYMSSGHNSPNTSSSDEIKSAGPTAGSNTTDSTRISKTRSRTNYKSESVETEELEAEEVADKMSVDLTSNESSNESGTTSSSSPESAV